MKKHTIKLLTVAITLAAILTLTGCPEPVTPDKPCTHENKKSVIETAATCTETGLEKIICADCGELIEENTIEALGHDFGDEWTVTTAATCTADGEETRTCKREGCKHFETRTIKAHHSWGDWTVTKEATCTEKGSKKHTCSCSNCGAEETVEIDALGHSYGNWNVTKEATCTTGTKKRVCSRCGHEEIETIPAHHTFIAGGCDKCGAYEYNEEDDYQIMAYVYSSVEDAKKGENERVLHFSFPNDTTDIPQIVTIDGQLCITIDDLIQMKSGYVGKTVRYFNFTSRNGLLNRIENKREYSGDPELLTNLKQIYIVIEQ